MARKKMLFAKIIRCEHLESDHARADPLPLDFVESLRDYNGGTARDDVCLENIGDAHPSIVFASLLTCRFEVECIDRQTRECRRRDGELRDCDEGATEGGGR